MKNWVFNNICEDTENEKTVTRYLPDPFRHFALLCGKGLNSSVFYNFSDIPFSLFGVLVGCVGLYFVFGKTQDK